MNDIETKTNWKLIFTKMITFTADALEHSKPSELINKSGLNLQSVCRRADELYPG